MDVCIMRSSGMVGAGRRGRGLGEPCQRLPPVVIGRARGGNLAWPAKRTTHAPAPAGRFGAVVCAGLDWTGLDWTRGSSEQNHMYDDAWSTGAPSDVVLNKN